MPSQHCRKQLLFKSIANLSFSFLKIRDKNHFLNQNHSLGENGKKEFTDLVLCLYKIFANCLAGLEKTCEVPVYCL